MTQQKEEEGRKIIEAMRLRHEWHQDYNEEKLKEIDKLLRTSFFQEYQEIIEEETERQKEIIEDENEELGEEEKIKDIEKEAKERVQDFLEIRYIPDIEELNEKMKRYINKKKYEYIENHDNKYSKEMKEIAECWRKYKEEKEEENEEEYY